MCHVYVYKTCMAEARGIRTPNLRVWNPTRYQLRHSFRIRVYVYIKAYTYIRIRIFLVRESNPGRQGENLVS